MRIIAAASQETWPDRVEVRNPAAVDVLTNVRATRFLRPFLLGPHTLSEAAAVLDRPISTTTYWIKRFVRLGLVVEIERRDRAGMAMPVYRSAARNLVVPFAHLPLDRRVALLDEGRLRLLRRFLDGIDEALAEDELGGIQIHADPATDGVAIELEDSASILRAARWTDAWGVVTLRPERARELAQELNALTERFPSERGGRRYVVHAGLAPEPRHRWRSAGD